MAKQNKNVSIHVDASALKTLRRAGAALSELANALETMNDDPCHGARRATRR
jgi:hypothetical protein